MAGRSDYCRSEPNLEELLDDEMMDSVLRSAGLDSLVEIMHTNGRSMLGHQPAQGVKFRDGVEVTAKACG
jgi:hypothetical protein